MITRMDEAKRIRSRNPGYAYLVLFGLFETANLNAHASQILVKDLDRYIEYYEEFRMYLYKRECQK